MQIRRAATALALLTALACAPTAWAASPAPSGGHEHGTGTGGGTAGGSPGPVDLNSPAAQLRVDLDMLLAEHAFLTIEQMRSGLTGAPDFAATAAAVEGNSVEVVDALASIYGDAARAPFGDIWRSHIGYLVDYAQSLRANDNAGRQQALDGLADYRVKLADFLRAANPGVQLDAIVDALDMHTAQLVEFIDKVHAGDHTGAYALERHAYPHMFEVGDALARVIANRFPDRFTGVRVAYSAAGTLRVTLDRLLAEHAFLAAEAMRAGIGAEPYFDAARTALDENAAELELLVTAAYGDEPAAAFRELWDAHDAAYLEYIAAVMAGDAAQIAQTLARLTDYATDLGEFLAAANPHLDAGELSTLFSGHAAHLTGQVDEFRAGDYAATYAIVREGYRHMFSAGELIAAGLAAQMPDKFPTTAAAPATDTVPQQGAWDGAAGLQVFTLLSLVAMALALLLGAGAALRGWRPPSRR